MSEIRKIADKTKAAVIGISESWLDSSVTDNEIKLDDYSITRNDRNRNGGGVCTYVRNNFAFLPRTDLQSDHIEATWLEIILPKTKPIIIGTVYRPPDQTNFLYHFESVLGNIRSDAEMIMLGDFNINFKDKNNGLLKKYSEVLNMFGLKQLINPQLESLENLQQLLTMLYVTPVIRFVIMVL